jgi:glycosyltransferase involved in cell wall biosynthesis
MPRVTVIIPTYNRSELLVKAVSSVLDQSFGDFELLVIDDCSPDDTRSKIEGIGDSRVAYFRNPENKGVSGSRNFGIERSRGEFIAFLDDDDEWLPGKLEKQVKVLDESPSNVGLVYTGTLSVDLTTGELIETTIPRYKGNVLNDLAFLNFIPTSSVLARRECFTRIGLFDENLSYGEDFDLWIRISTEFLIDYIQDPLVIHKDHPQTTTANYKKVAVNVKRILDKHSALFVSNKKGLSNYLLMMGTAYCFDGNQSEGRKAIMNAIKASPFDLRLYYNLALTLIGTGMYRNIKRLKYNLMQTVKNYMGRS